MTDLALFYLMTRQISFSERSCCPFCDACVFRVPVFEVKFLEWFRWFPSCEVYFIFKKCLKEFQGEGLKCALGKTSLYFKVQLNDLVYLPNEGSLTLICPQLYLDDWNISKTSQIRLLNLHEDLKYRCSSIRLYCFLCLAETLIRFFTLEYKNNNYHATSCK